VTITDDKYEALGNASALLVATEWPEFADGNLETIGNLLQERLVFDGRNIFQTEVMRAAGFSYYSIGRRPVLSSN
jgi:UDPglucose 6-dehydrogenase